ncbi:MAG: hypothetical protein AAGE76_00485 [Pseudomonadota bacterium]
MRVLVASASLDLGIDIGPVDLVVQLGSVKRVATGLPRIGRSNQHLGEVPTARIFPLSRDELVAAAALMRCIDRRDPDRIAIPDHPFDILAQQIVAAVPAEDQTAEALLELVRPGLSLPRPVRRGAGDAGRQLSHRTRPPRYAGP